MFINYGVCMVCVEGGGGAVVPARYIPQKVTLPIGFIFTPSPHRGPIVLWAGGGGPHLPLQKERTPCIGERSLNMGWGGGGSK